MNVIRWFLAGAAGAILCTTTFGQVVSRGHCNVNRKPFLGTNYVQRITAEERDAIVRWNPEKEAPRITIAEAVQKAKQTVESRFPDYAWTFTGLALRQWRTEADAWYYNVTIALADAPLGSEEYFTFTLWVGPDGWMPAMVPEDDSDRSP